MGKRIFLSIVLLIHLSLSLPLQGGEILLDGAEILRPLYQDPKQGFYEVRLKPPGKPSDYKPMEYFKLFQFLIYRHDKESNQYSKFVPYKLICNIPPIRTAEVDAKPLQYALFQGPNGLILVELNYEKGEWKSLMNLPKEFDDTPRMTWDIQYTTNPNLFVYSRAISKEELGYYDWFELGVIDVSLDKVKVLVPQVFRQNSPTSSMSPTTPLVVYRDEFVFFPMTKGPMLRGNFK